MGKIGISCSFASCLAWNELVEPEIANYDPSWTNSCPTGFKEVVVHHNILSSITATT
jgi:hypothetical protein